MCVSVFFPQWLWKLSACLWISSESFLWDFLTAEDLTEYFGCQKTESLLKSLHRHNFSCETNPQWSSLLLLEQLCESWKLVECLNKYSILLDLYNMSVGVFSKKREYLKISSQCLFPGPRMFVSRPKACDFVMLLWLLSVSFILMSHIFPHSSCVCLTTPQKMQTQSLYLR